MNQALILSEQLPRVSDGPQGFFYCRIAHASASIGPQHASDRGGHARNTEDFIPSLRPAKLPLRRWSWSWPEALSLDQHADRSSSPTLCSQRGCRACPAVNRHAKRTARYPRPNLRNQYRAFAAARGSRIAHEDLARPTRFGPGGRNTGRYGGSLSRRLTAAYCGGEGR
jgi:hypothetical protein